MKKKAKRPHRVRERDTLRAEYDFSGAVRGTTISRYKQGTNVCVIDPEVLDVFPDSAAVNDALKALARVVRQGRRARSKR